MTRLPIVLLLLMSSAATAAPPATGYRAQAKITDATRIDWVYPLANQSILRPPADWTEGYDSAEQTFELFVPEDYDAKKSYPVVLFISPSNKAMGWRSWQATCKQQGVIFVGPHNAGNNCPSPRRVRIVLDALDQVRRDYNVDADRTYISGFSGGGRIACMIGFSLPEYFGGAIPICAGGDLRGESYLRRRVIDRLSVAHVTGQSDFNRAEVQRFRHPQLAEVGVRSRLWTVEKMGHSVPGSKTLSEVLRWLDQSVKDRRELATQRPVTRIAGSESPGRQQRAKQQLTAGKELLKDKKTLYAGLMLVKGVMVRWPELSETDDAKKILLHYEKPENLAWEKEDIAQQRRFLIARARALDAYASGPLPKQYAAQHGDMVRGAIQLWTRVLQDGQDPQAVAQGKKRLEALKKLVEPKKDGDK